MPVNLGVRNRIRVTAPVQGDMAVTVYQADNSSTKTAYTTETGDTTHTFPVTVAAGATTDFWVQPGLHYVSTTNASIEYAKSYGVRWSGYVDGNGVYVNPIAPSSTSSALNEYFCVAIGDETTVLTTGTAKVTFRMPFAMTVTAVRASLTTVSSSGIPTFDINDGGTTILSTKLTIDANELTSTTAATAAVISDTALADDAEITIDVDVAGTSAAGAKIWIYGTRAA